MNRIEYFVVSIFVLQAVLMGFDEFYFHWRRVVPKFERIGHPIDTFFVLMCYFCVVFLELNQTNLIIYGILCLISCLCIVKDEAVHKKYCSAQEQFLHALLFILHPIILVALFVCWPSIQKSIFGIFTFQSEFLNRFFYIQLILSCLFFMYQIVYWNFTSARLSIEEYRRCE